MFIGEKRPHDESILVHNKVIPPGFGKFKITTVFARRALGWTQYDAVVHCVSSYIVWDLNDVKKTKYHNLVSPNIASEGSDLSGAKEVFNGRGRKKTRNESEHASAQRKWKPDRGLSYSSGKRQRKPTRKLGDACPVTCRNKCQTKIPQEQREELFNSYWAIGNVQGQWQFIKSHITVTEKVPVPVTRTRGNESPVKSRHSKTGAFPLYGTEVCKFMFLNTLAISDRVMRTATGKSKKGHTKLDKRGRNPSRCYPPQLIEVRKHIKRFPVIKSHYVREKSKRQFLSSNLNFHTMFEMVLYH